MLFCTGEEMNEEPRDWEVVSSRSQDRVYAQERDMRMAGELLLQEGLTKEEALTMLATMGEVMKFGSDSNCFYVNVKKQI